MTLSFGVADVLLALLLALVLVLLSRFGALDWLRVLPGSSQRRTIPESPFRFGGSRTLFWISLGNLVLWHFGLMLDFVDAGEWIQFLGGVFCEIPLFVACSLVPISIAVSVWRYFWGECSAWEKYTPALAVFCLWLMLAELHYMLTP